MSIIPQLYTNSFVDSDEEEEQPQALEPRQDSLPQQQMQEPDSEDADYGMRPVGEDQQPFLSMYDKKQKQKDRFARRERMTKEIGERGRYWKEEDKKEDEEAKIAADSGMSPVKEEKGVFETIGRMAKWGVGGTFSGLAGGAADLATLGSVLSEQANKYSGYTEEQKESFGDAVEALEDHLHPWTTEGFAEKLKIASGDEPEGALEKGAWTAGTLLGGGGIFGLWKHGFGKAVAGSVGAATAGELVGEDAPWWVKMMAYIAGDVLARGGIKALSLATGGKEAMREEFGRMIQKSVAKDTPLTKKALEYAEGLGLEVPASVTTGRGVIDWTEKMLARQSSGRKAAKVASERMNKGVINALEEQAAVKFSQLPEEAARVGEEAQVAATEGKEALLSGREGAYAEMAEIVGDKPIETATTRKVVDATLKSTAVPPEQKKFIEGISKDLFRGGEELGKQLEELHPYAYTRLELGEKVQGEVVTKANAAHTAASDKYKALERLSGKVAVNESKMSSLMEKMAELEETNAPDYLKTKLSNLKTKSNEIWNSMKDGEKVPANKLIKFEQLVNDAIKWDAQHDHTRMLIPIKKEAEKVIEGSLQGNSKLRYRDAKSSWRKYYEDFLDPDAVRKMRFTQKPEELATLVRTPSYFKQLSETVGEDNANALRRMVLEENIGKEGLVSGDISKKHLDKMREYKDVFGDKYKGVAKSLESAAGETAGSSENILAAIEKIDSELATPLSEAAKTRIGKVRQSLIQDLKAANPKMASQIDASVGKLGMFKDTIDGKFLETLVTGDPTKFLGKINTAEDLASFRKLVSGSKNGEQVYDSVRRMKLQEAIAEGALNANGSANLEKLSSSITNLVETDLGKALMGKDGMKFYEDLKNYSGDMADSAYVMKKAANEPGGRAGKLMWSSLANGLYQFFIKWNPKFLLLHFGIKGGQRIVSRLLTDPDVRRGMMKALKETAGQGGRAAKDLGLAYRRIQPALNATLEHASDIEKGE